MFSAETARSLRTMIAANEEIRAEMQVIEKVILEAVKHGRTSVKIDNIYDENKKELRSLGYKVIIKYTRICGEMVCLGTVISW